MKHNKQPAGRPQVTGDSGWLGSPVMRELLKAACCWPLPGRQELAGEEARCSHVLAMISSNTFVLFLVNAVLFDGLFPCASHKPRSAECDLRCPTVVPPTCRPLLQVLQRTLRGAEPSNREWCRLPRPMPTSRTRSSRAACSFSTDPLQERCSSSVCPPYS